MKIIEFLKTTKCWVIVCAIGIWAQFAYTLGTAKDGVQSVYVTGGSIESEVNNTVRVNGALSVDNEVNVNISAINGYRNCFYNSYSKHPKDYYRLPVNVN